MVEPPPATGSLTRSRASPPSWSADAWLLAWRQWAAGAICVVATPQRGTPRPGPAFRQMQTTHAGLHGGAERCQAARAAPLPWPQRRIRPDPVRSDSRADPPQGGAMNMNAREKPAHTPAGPVPERRPRSCWSAASPRAPGRPGRPDPPSAPTARSLTRHVARLQAALPAAPSNPTR